MKKTAFLFAVIAVVAFFLAATGPQAPIQRNAYTTNLVVTNILTTLAPVTGISNYCITFNSDNRPAKYFMAPTNDLYFNSTTNQKIGCSQAASVVIEANGANRNLYFNSNWKWMGATNNPPTVLNSGKTGILVIETYGTATTETNIVAAFVQQP